MPTLRRSSPVPERLADETGLAPAKPAEDDAPAIGGEERPAGRTVRDYLSPFVAAPVDPHVVDDVGDMNRDPPAIGVDIDGAVDALGYGQGFNPSAAVGPGEPPHRAIRAGDVGDRSAF